MTNKKPAAWLEVGLGTETFVLVGNSYSLDSLDLSLLKDVDTIGCNRILRHSTFVPLFVMIADREA